VPSEEPLARRLAELNIEIPHKGAFSAFLDRLKGARVALPCCGTTLEGTIVGIEEIKRGDQKAKEPHLVVFAEEGRLTRVPLLELEELTFLDESVQRDLRTLLDALFSGLRKDRKRLSLQAVGTGSRQISIGYVVAAPVWKTSYRIVLPTSGEERPLLQGWALVDNTTEDDWQGVELSLVAGLPISFIHDLYTPRYRARPVVRVQEGAAVAPPVIEAGVAAEYDDDDALMERSRPHIVACMSMSEPAPMLSRKSKASMSAAAQSSVEVQTRNQEVGDLFTYEITRPIDIGRGRSALVPILQSEIEIERVALYNEEVRDKNPMTAFRLKNSTGLVLEGGPVTVFEGDSYAGEAMLDTVRRDDVRLTPYSVELGITVKRISSSQTENVTKVTRKGQKLWKHFRKLKTVRYEFASRLDRQVTLFLDHPFHYELLEGSTKPVEITDRFWRFQLALPAKETTAFTVTEVIHESESISIPEIAHVQIEQLFANALIPEKTRAQLEEIATIAEAIAKAEQQVSQNEYRAQKLEDGQDRLRENLKAMGTTAAEAKLRGKYVDRLAAEEEKLEQLRLEITGLQTEIEAKREEMSRKVAEFELK